MLSPVIRFEHVKKPGFLLIGGLGGFFCVMSLIGFTSDAVSGKIDRQLINTSETKIVSTEKKLPPTNRF